MTISNSYDARWLLYLSINEVIENLKITFREMDVISCIICNRSEKKISAILGIEPKTVNVHVQNITSKLRCSSKDQIIDFIENLGFNYKILLQQQYYTHLLIENLFKTQIKEVSKQVGDKSPSVNLLDNNLQVKFIKKLKKDLSLIGIKIDKNSNNLISIDKDNYYLSFFQSIEQLLALNINIRHIKDEFTSKLAKIINPVDNYKIYPAIYILKYIKFNKSYLLGIILLLFIILGTFIYYNNRFKITSAEIENNLAKFMAEFSADNVTFDQIQKNHDLIEQVDNYLQSKAVRHYFKVANPTKLLNFLYCLHALASYYAVHNHDGIKARQMMLVAQDLAKNYIVQHNKVAPSFEKINKEEMYHELAIIKGLPEIYAKITYVIGRSYIYSNQEKIQEALEYFELARYLGNKTNIFEGYLSSRSGIAIVKSFQAQQYIAEKKFTEAKSIISKSIALYKELKQDDKEYISEYQPGANNTKTIIPINDNYNQLECAEKLVRYYTMLIKISDNIDDKNSYMAEIANEFISSSNDVGILQRLDKLSPRKRAMSYNNLGEVLLIAYSNQLNYNLLRRAVIDEIKELNVSSTDDFKLIEDIFPLSCKLSRNTEFAKADSYNGLIKLYTIKLKQRYDQNLKDKITQLERKKDEINSKLGRRVQD